MNIADREKITVRPGQRVRWYGDGYMDGLNGVVKQVNILKDGILFLIKFEIGTTYLADERDLESQRIRIVEE